MVETTSDGNPISAWPRRSISRARNGPQNACTSAIVPATTPASAYFPVDSLIIKMMPSPSIDIGSLPTNAAEEKPFDPGALKIAA